MAPGKFGSRACLIADAAEVVTASGEAIVEGLLWLTHHLPAPPKEEYDSRGKGGGRHGPESQGRGKITVTQVSNKSQDFHGALLQALQRPPDISASKSIDMCIKVASD